MAGQVDGEAGLSGSGGAHDDDEFGLALVCLMVEGGGVYAGPPWTAVEGKRRVKEWRMEVVKRRENGFHGEEEDRLVMGFDEL